RRLRVSRSGLTGRIHPRAEELLAGVVGSVDAELERVADEAAPARLVAQALDAAALDAHAGHMSGAPRESCQVLAQDDAHALGIERRREARERGIVRDVRCRN